MFGESIIRSDIFNWGLENLIIFSVAGVLVAHVINKSRFERFVYADSTKKLADIQKNYNKELKKEVDVKTEHIFKSSWMVWEHSLIPLCSRIMKRQDQVLKLIIKRNF